MSDPPFTTAQLDEITSITAGTATWKPVRRHLGVTAFGINAFVAAAEGGELIEDHDELGAQAGHHQELYFVATGAARFTVDGTDIEATAGTFVYVSEPSARRAAHATADNTTVLVIGAPDGAAFTPSEWEFSFAAEPAARDGDFERALEVMHEGLELHPNGATLLYNLACYETLAGHHDEAVAHLAAALDLDPAIAEWAVKDTDLDPLRDRADFPALS
jgi:tetratricopeptide (TPR) repeat protein